VGLKTERMNFRDKTVLITGASSGIGYELAMQLAGKRCSLALVARRKNLLEELEQKLKDKPAEVKTYVCDVSNNEAAGRTVKNIINDFGKIDVAILNAGVGVTTSIKNFDAGKAAYVLNINVLGIVNFVEKLLPSFLERKEGIIAGVSSLADTRGFPGTGFYCASKAAASTLLESLRVELKPYNISVITVKPGFIRTPMTAKNKFKMPFLMDVDKAAKIIIKGMEKEKRVIQFPFPTVVGAKFLRIIPGFLFEFFASKQLRAK